MWLKCCVVWLCYFSKLLVNPTVHKDIVNVRTCVLSRTVHTHRSHQDMQCTYTQHSLSQWGGGIRDSNPDWRHLFSSGHLLQLRSARNRRVSLHTLVASTPSSYAPHKKGAGHRLSTPWNLRLACKKSCYWGVHPQVLSGTGWCGNRCIKSVGCGESDLCHCANSILH